MIANKAVVICQSFEIICSNNPQITLSWFTDDAWDPIWEQRDDLFCRILDLEIIELKQYVLWYMSWLQIECWLLTKISILDEIRGKECRVPAYWLELPHEAAFLACLWKIRNEVLLIERIGGTSVTGSNPSDWLSQGRNQKHNFKTMQGGRLYNLYTDTDWGAAQTRHHRRGAMLVGMEVIPPPFQHLHTLTCQCKTSKRIDSIGLSWNDFDRWCWCFVEISCCREIFCHTTRCLYGKQAAPR